MSKPMSTPPPPPSRSSRASRSFATVDSENSIGDPAVANPYTVPIILIAFGSLFVLLLVCGGGIGAAIALKSTGSVQGLGGGGDKDGTGRANSQVESIESAGAADGKGAAGNGEPAPLKTEDQPNPQQQTGIQERPQSSSAAGEDDPKSGVDTNGTSDKPKTRGSTEDAPAPASNGGVNIPGATFFGISSTGERVVYVVDCSLSMEGDRFSKAKAELLKSIRSLLVSQKYMIIFFAQGEFPMYDPSPANNLVEGSDQNLAKTENWVNRFPLHEGTDPTLAMRRALSFRPDSIFLLTDGEFESTIPELIRKQNMGSTKINTISFTNRVGEPLLKKIANESGGVYRHVP